MSEDIRQAAMEVCLELSKDACAVFDALEAKDIGMDAATAMVRIRNNASDLVVAVQTLLLESLPGRMR